MQWHLPAVLAAVSAVLAFDMAAADEKPWEPIEAKQFRVDFAPPGLDRGLFGKRDGLYGRQFIGSWEAGDEQAVVYVYELWPGYQPARVKDLKDTLASFKRFKNVKLKLLTEVKMRNALGRLTYQRFNTARSSCFGFQQYYGMASGSDNSTGIRTNYLVGYYCAGAPVYDSTIRDVLSQIALREADE